MQPTGAADSMASDSEREEGELEEGEIPVNATKPDSEEEVGVAVAGRLHASCTSLEGACHAEIGSPPPTALAGAHASTVHCACKHGALSLAAVCCSYDSRVSTQGEVNDAPLPVPPSAGRNWLPAPPPQHRFPRQPRRTEREPEPQGGHSNGRRRSSGSRQRHRRRSRSRSRGHAPQKARGVILTPPAAPLATADSLPPGLAETPRHGQALPPPPSLDVAAGRQSESWSVAADGQDEQHIDGRHRRNGSGTVPEKVSGLSQAALRKERQALAEVVQDLTTGTSMKDAIKWVTSLRCVGVNSGK